MSNEELVMSKRERAETTETTGTTERDELVMSSE